MNFQEKLANVVNRYEEVEALLSSPSISADELVKLNKEIAVLEPVVGAIHNYQKQKKSFDKLFFMISLLRKVIKPFDVLF